MFPKANPDCSVTFRAQRVLSIRVNTTTEPKDRAPIPTIDADVTKARPLHNDASVNPRCPVIGGSKADGVEKMRAIARVYCRQYFVVPQ